MDEKIVATEEWIQSLEEWIRGKERQLSFFIKEIDFWEDFLEKLKKKKAIQKHPDEIKLHDGKKLKKKWEAFE